MTRPNQIYPSERPEESAHLTTPFYLLSLHAYTYLCSNSNLNLDTSLNIDNDLLDDLGGGVEINQSLVDSHLVHVPGLGTFTAGGFSGGDL